MAKSNRTPGKIKVKDIVSTLLNSEIPEIQNIVNELTACTQQLDQHSQKLKGYAVRIQELSGEDIEASKEAVLGERLKGLEKALAEVAVKAAKLPAYTSRVRSEFPVERTASARAEEPQPEPVEPKAELAVREEVGVAKNSFPGVRVREESFTTPEGFVVKRRFLR